ncbi:MAG: glycosyltransferase [bacterium]|nr:glycosyltransferase [bacterium]
MSIRFRGRTRKTIVVESRHRDASGGGRYTAQLAACFQEFGEVFLGESLADDETFSRMHGIQIPRYQNSFQPDLFVAVSHWGGIKPIGKKNAHAMFFPLEANRSPAEFDYLICLNEFVRLHSVARFPEKRDHAFVITPAVELERHAPPRPKERLLLSVGNYFRESDGHSKNQHIVLDWFARNRLWDTHRLVFTGFVVSQDYFAELQDSAARIPNVSVLSAVARADLLDLYARASFLIHANGFGRDNSYQTEHFGYVAIEAMASECQPIVHNSGGCRDLPGVRVWNQPDDIGPLMYPYDGPALRRHAASFSSDVMRRHTQNFWRQVCSELDA